MFQFGALRLVWVSLPARPCLNRAYRYSRWTGTSDRSANPIAVELKRLRSDVAFPASRAPLADGLLVQPDSSPK
jgi:hypothetical protein